MPLGIRVTVSKERTSRTASALSIIDRVGYGLWVKKNCLVRRWRGVKKKCPVWCGVSKNVRFGAEWVKKRQVRCGVGKKFMLWSGVIFAFNAEWLNAL